MDAHEVALRGVIPQSAEEFACAEARGEATDIGNPEQVMRLMDICIETADRIRQSKSE